MNTMKWLLRREFWEHKGAMLWAPLVAAALILALMGSSFIYSSSRGLMDDKVTITLDSGEKTTVTQAFSSLPAEKKAMMVSAVANGYFAPAAPLFVMMSLVIFFYCLNGLSEERRDRSILFWKSLPVSDAQTVLSKVVTAVVVIPVITIAVAFVMSLLFLLLAGVAASFQGVQLFGPVLGSADFYLTPLRVLGLLPVYIVWALPTIGWLMLVSAWAKSKVFLWAVVAPLIGVAIIKWTTFLFGPGLNMDWILQNVVSRGLVGVIPGTWLPLSGIENKLNGTGPSDAVAQIFTSSWMTLGTAPAIIGAIAGAAMIYGAIRLRRWKDEG